MLFRSYLAAAVACGLVFVPKLGISVDGSTRWIGYGELRMQPSEIAKLALLVAAATLLARRSDAAADGSRWMEWLKPMVALFVPLTFLVFVEPDMDSVMVLGFIAFAMLIVSGVPGGVLVRMCLVVVPAALLMSVLKWYRVARMLAFFHPSSHAAASYQATQSVMAIGRGGIFGVGLGAGRAKWLHLPNAHTDFIFAIIGEELGLIGTLFVLACFAGLAALGFLVARRSPDRFGALLAAGITVWIAGQAVINLGAVVGVLPVAGIALPFLSAGGSSLVVTMLEIGRAHV